MRREEKRRIEPSILTLFLPTNLLISYFTFHTYWFFVHILFYVSIFFPLHLLMSSFIYPSPTFNFTLLFINAFTYKNDYLLVHLFICSFVCLFIYSFICIFIDPFLCSFIYLITYLFSSRLKYIFCFLPESYYCIQIFFGPFCDC